MAGYEGLKIILLGSKDIKDRPKVYFCATKTDKEKYLKQITDEIQFINNKVVIFYHEGLSLQSEESENLFFSDLGEMNLFVIPVTADFLFTDNEARTREFAFAMEKHIPVLPLIQEPKLESSFNAICGNLQCLNKIDSLNDTTGISYEEKLKKYLDSVLISDDLIEAVKKSFKAYIFLSYRKKDRIFANEIMKIIHNVEACRDVAIWYDEFLSPGEDFNDSIKYAFEKSSLFAMVVTPNLLERPNYVMNTEYPMALSSSTPILPIEAFHTDKVLYADAYSESPEILSVEKEPELAERLEEIFSDGTPLNNTPEHLFHIGMAYFNGIDVEKNIDKAIELLTLSAQAGFPPAIEKLIVCYREGEGVAVNYENVYNLLKVYYESCKEFLGEDDPKTLLVMNSLASSLLNLARYQEALDLLLVCYEKSKKVHGPFDTNTLSALSNISACYGLMGEYAKAYEICRESYELKKEALGEDNSNTLISLHQMASHLISLGKYAEAIELLVRCYELSKRVNGDNHHDTLLCMIDIATAYGITGKYESGLELALICFEISKNIYGETHPFTLNCISTIANLYGSLGKKEEAYNYILTVYEVKKELFKEEHPETLNALSNLASAAFELGKREEAIVYLEKCYKLHCLSLGPKHPYSLTILDNLASMYMSSENPEKAYELYCECYEARKQVLGEDHPETLVNYSTLAYVMASLGEADKALKICRKVYFKLRTLLGDENISTLWALKYLVITYHYSKDYSNAAAYGIACYETGKRILGEKHSDTMIVLYNLVSSLTNLGEYDKAIYYNEIYYKNCLELYGEGNRNTIESHFKRGYLLCGQQNFRDGYAHMLAAYRLCKKYLGTEDEFSQMALTFINEAKKKF